MHGVAGMKFLAEKKLDILFGPKRLQVLKSCCYAASLVRLIEGIKVIRVSV